MINRQGFHFSGQLCAFIELIAKGLIRVTATVKTHRGLSIGDFNARFGLIGRTRPEQQHRVR